MLFKTPDGTWVDTAGRGVLYFSCDRFLSDIVVRRSCFLCGASRREVEFNDEHVLPKWLLRKHRLFDRAITLPNLTDYTYGRYKTPCCKPCNSFLGETIEQSMQEAFSGGFETLLEHVDTHGTDALFQWMSLLFLKTHLKDLTLRLDRAGAASGNIGDEYAWEQLHHVHCIARSILTRAELDSTACGSMFMVPIADEQTSDRFDFVDNHFGQVVALRSDDVGVVAVMNDSFAVASLLHELMATIDEPITPLQFRELYAHAVYTSIWLDPRPQNGSQLDWETGRVVIRAERPSTLSLGPATQEGFAEILEFACRGFIERGVHPEGRTPDEVSALTRAGHYRFLFDAHDRFIRPSGAR